MKSQREVAREYRKMLEAYEEPVQANKVNCYRCECSHITKTVDIDNGVTPFMFDCEECGAGAISTFYNDIAPSKKPTYEWFRPSLEQTMKLRKKEGLLEHILQGGLDVRAI